MLLVPLRNALVQQALSQRIEQRIPIAPIKASGDYNGITWGVFSPDDADTTVVTIDAHFWTTVTAFGAADVISDALTPLGLKCSFAPPGVTDAPSVTVEISNSAIRAGTEEAVIGAILDIPRTALLPVFQDAFEKLRAKATATALRVPLSAEESMYVFVHKSNVCVVLSLMYSHEHDALYAKSFLQEWALIRRTTNFSNAPSFSASFVKKPLSMSGVSNAEQEKDGRCWAEFTLFDSHDGPLLSRVVEMIMMFRATMNYHIVCTKVRRACVVNAVVVYVFSPVLSDPRSPPPRPSAVFTSGAVLSRHPRLRCTRRCVSELSHHCR